MFVYRRVSLGGLNILNSVDTFDHIGFRATTFCEKIIGKQELNCCKASFRFRNFRNLIHSDSLDFFLFVGWDWQPKNPGSQWVNYKFIFLKETLWTFTIQSVFHICWGRVTQKSWEKIQLMITEKSHFCWLETTCFKVDVRKFNGLENLISLRSSATMLVWQCPTFGSYLTSKWALGWSFSLSDEQMSN